MYQFDRLIERRGTNSLKWKVKENELPMWVADMDFQTAPEIIEALHKRVQHGVFGYTVVPDSWREAVSDWWERRHHFRIEKEWLLFCTGVIPAISAAVSSMTAPGEQVLVLSPVYNHFYISIEENGRMAAECRLRYQDGQYHIDWESFEQRLAEPKTTMLLLSNPHNPTGNIWTADTLAEIGRLCAKHQVLVLSDEIHCDLTDPGFEYVPFASVSELCAQNSITCIAPTKTFNLAGLQTAAVFAPNPGLLEKMKKALQIRDAGQPGAFAIEAAEAAFTRGEPWLDGLREYIAENKNLVCSYIKERLPQVKVVSSHATYLMWLDFGAVTDDSSRLCRYIREKTGLYMNVGALYRGNGDTFARLNVACPKTRIEDALRRLEAGVKGYVEEK